MRAKINSRPVDTASSGISLDDFLSRLDKVKKFGDKYMARCPAHEDGRPSLQVKAGDKGIMLRCYAGCAFDEIISVMDLRPQDLFYDSLSDKKRDEYRYNGLLEDIRRINTVLYFYENDMAEGKLNDEQLAKFRNVIAEKNRLCAERDQIFKRLWP